MTTFVGIFDKYIDSQDGDRSYKHAYNRQELNVGCEYVVPEKEFLATPIESIQLVVKAVPLVLNPVPPATDVGSNT